MRMNGVVCVATGCVDGSKNHGMVWYDMADVCDGYRYLADESMNVEWLHWQYNYNGIVVWYGRGL